MTTFRDRMIELFDENKDKNHRFRRKDFARYLGVSIGKANAWLDGNGRPNFELLKNVANHIGVSAAWLIGGDGERTLVLSPGCEELPVTAKEDYQLLLEFLAFKYHAQHVIASAQFPTKSPSEPE